MTWSTEIFAHPACASVAAWAERLPRDRWPTVAELDALYVDRLRPLRLVEDRTPRRTRGPRELADVYEVRIAERDELPTRHQSWHDLMNVLVWCTFPKSKRALTRRQHAITLGRPQTRSGTPQSRTREQDALALFDEGGIVLATSDERPWLFGHALLEAVANGELDVEDRRGATVRIDAADPDRIDEHLAALLADRTRFVEPVRKETVWLRATLASQPYFTATMPSGENVASANPALRIHSSATFIENTSPLPVANPKK